MCSVYRLLWNANILMRFSWQGWVILNPQQESVSTSGISLQARNARNDVGNIYFRHSNDSSDLSIVNSMACGSFDGVFIVTYVCVADALVC